MNLQKYIEQLIEDLDELTKNPPSPAYIEAPPHLENEVEISELALVPYKPISEWTGIPFEAFPEEYQLTTKQCQEVIDAIYRLFEAMNIELVDSAAKKMPAKDLYFVLTSSWDNFIQYLPNAGFDLELCTDGPEDCPYGEEYCSCGDYWEEELDHNNLHERYNKVIPEIAKTINSGHTCFLNLDTLEIESSGIQTSNIAEHAGLKNKEWDLCCRIEPEDKIGNNDTMKSFLLGIVNNQLRIQLSNAIEKENASEAFNSIIKKTDLFEEWLDYKKECNQTYIKKNIWTSINNIQIWPSEEINGFYNDDGEKIDPESVPIPGLCIICIRYQDADPEEKLLCMMNRHDQRNDANFECDMFEKNPF